MLGWTLKRREWKFEPFKSTLNTNVPTCCSEFHGNWNVEKTKQNMASGLWLLSFLNLTCFKIGSWWTTIIISYVGGLALGNFLPSFLFYLFSLLVNRQNIAKNFSRAFEWIMLFHSPQMESCNGHKSDKCAYIRPFPPAIHGQSPFMDTLNRVTQIHTDRNSYFLHEKGK